ncbi:MAG: hypothetical protein MASP_01650 [Candidatus Methanolliviera sp. GoM_asphalt]|nr:MAG: hypothetical protein MASP_01650 [Candidatus Methanolliviera sp. GoM_asphalt]
MEDGRVLDTNRRGVAEENGIFHRPFLPSVFIVGETLNNTYLKGLDEKLIGTSEGEEKKIYFNPYLLKNSEITIPKKNFETIPKKGDILYRPLAGVVTGVSEEGVNINCAYTFDIKVISIEKK